MLTALHSVVRFIEKAMETKDTVIGAFVDIRERLTAPLGQLSTELCRNMEYPIPSGDGSWRH